MSDKERADQSTEESYTSQIEPEVILIEDEAEKEKADKELQSGKESITPSTKKTVRKRSLRKKAKGKIYQDSVYSRFYYEDSDNEHCEGEVSNWMSTILPKSVYNLPFKKKKRGKRRGTKSKNSDEDGMSKKGKCVFSEVEEKQLVDYILAMEQMMYGITSQDVRQLAYEYAHKLGLPHNFNHDKQMAGVDWCRGFMKRHPDIGTKRVDGPGGSGYTDVESSEAIKQFYDRVEMILKEQQIQSDRIFNVDESGITCFTEGAKMFANRARRKIGRTFNIEKMTISTTICCMGASGVFISPMIVFKRHNCGPGVMHEAPPNFVARKSHNGWITESLYLEWLYHFQRETNSSPNNKTLIISDHHSTHISLQVHDFIVKHGIFIVPVPPHSNNILHPLDIDFFKQMQSDFQDEIDTWQNAHPGKMIKSDNIVGLFTSAYLKCASAEVAISAFNKAGIVPFDRDAYSKLRKPPEPVPSSYTIPPTQHFMDYSVINSINYTDHSPIPSHDSTSYINDNLINAAAQHYKKVKYFQQNQSLS